MPQAADQTDSDELARKCQSLLVDNDATRTIEYSGCLPNTIRRYFGTDEEPAVEYDAVHLRAGDLSARGGGKTFTDLEMFFILTAMCRLSKRDIVVLTEGHPKLPMVKDCGDRVVMASDESLHDTIQIFQHAKNVAAGSSSFAGLLLEAARPERVITLSRVLSFVEWVACENWTVIGKRGAVFHFDSRESMLSIARSGIGVYPRSFKTETQKAGIKGSLELRVVRRTWNKDGSWMRRT